MPLLDIRNLTKSIPNNGRGLTKADYVFCVGDFGLVFSPTQTPTEKYWLDWLDKKPYTTIFIDGNHDNHPRIWSDEFEVVEMFGGDVIQISKSVFYLFRSTIYNIQGKTFLCMGGATSIDKLQRTEGIDWWSTEEPNYMSWKFLFETVAENPVVDYVVTHDVPACVYDDLQELWGAGDYYKDANSSVPKGLQELYNQVTFKHWFAGHHHIDQTFHKDKGPVTILYEESFAVE